jgi:uncharacterized repeat protein (TIGR03803 family)
MRKTILHRTLRVASIALALYTLAAAPPKAANVGTFRIISTLPDYSTPGGLVEGSPGIFYSAAQLAGTGSFAVFSVTIKGVTKTLASFPSGYNFSGPPVAGPNGRLYDGVGYQGTGNMFSVAAGSGVQEYPTQAIVPSLTQNLPNGNFIGAGSGATGWDLATCDLRGIVTPVYSFPSTDVVLYPAIYANDGNYYGIAYGSAGPYLYRVTPSGSFTKLHNFSKASFSGRPLAPLLQATDGNLYGAAPYGGANGTGMIYKVSLAGQYSVVYTFPKGPAGYPVWLIQASDGNFYGDTYGNTGSPYGHSVLFRVTPQGQYTELFAWPATACNCSLTQGVDGKIYGIAELNFHSFFVWNGGLPKPAPSAPRFTPQSGPPGTKVLLWGYNLLLASVQFNGVAAASVVSSGPNYVWATAPSGATTGPITVTTPGGSYTTPMSFTVE